MCSAARKTFLRGGGGGARGQLKRKQLMRQTFLKFRKLATEISFRSPHQAGHLEALPSGVKG